MISHIFPEFEVLKSVDFDRIGFGVVVVEADEHK